jgi:hypothetical protein
VVEAGVVVDGVLVAASAIADPIPKVNPTAPAATPAARSGLLMKRICSSVR